MTVPLILSILCQYINGMGYKAVQGPSNNPAPEGLYISVVPGNVRQVGDRIIPGPAVAADHKYKEIMKVLTVQFYEVEGDGEAIRAVQNALQSEEFDAFVAANKPATQHSIDTGFSVWEIGDIIDNSMQDGTYFIQQKTMTADFQFYDRVAHTAPRMMSVNGVLCDVEKNRLVTDAGDHLVTDNNLHLIAVTTKTQVPFHVEVSNG